MKRLLASSLLAAACGCVSSTPAGEQVHITSNPVSPAPVPPTESDPLTDAPAEISQLKTSGVLVRVETETHRAYVNRALWESLGHDTRTKRSFELANFCARRSGGTVSLSVFDDATGQQIGAVADAPR